MINGLIRKPNLNRLIIISLLLYVPFHVLEEGAFGFPAWAESYWRIPHYTFEKWVIHNFFFAGALILGYVIYRIGKDRLLVLGVAIVCWGIMNTVNHIGCSLVFLTYEPGILTSLLWIPVFKWTVDSLRNINRLTWKLMLASFLLAAVLYWGVPITTFIYVGLG
jgi:hypothetical protein